MCRMCDSATHAALNSPKPRACLRLTPYRPTNAASRSLHSYQPYAWLRHTPYLRAAQTLKPTCRVCAVRTHAFFALEAACTCVGINAAPAFPKKAACTFQSPKCRLLFCSRRYRLFNNDPRIQRLHRAVVVRTDGAGEFFRLRLVDVVISFQHQP